MSLYISAYMAAVVAKNAASAHGCIKRCWPPHRTHTSWFPTVPSTSTCLGVDVQPHRLHRCIRAPLFRRTVHIDVPGRRCPAAPPASMYTSAVVQPHRPHRCVRAPLFSDAAHIDVYTCMCPATPLTSMCTSVAEQWRAPSSMWAAWLDRCARIHRCALVRGQRRTYTSMWGPRA